MYWHNAHDVVIYCDSLVAIPELMTSIPVGTRTLLHLEILLFENLVHGTYMYPIAYNKH